MVDQKLLFFQSASILGGAERVFLDLLNGLPPEWRARTVVVLPSKGPLIEKIRFEEGALPEVLIHPFPPLFKQVTKKRPISALFRLLVSAPGLFLYIYRLRKLVLEQSVGIVYAQGLKPMLLSLLLGRVRVIWHLHDFLPRNKMFRLVLLLLGKAPDRAIAISHAVAERFMEVRPKRWGVRPKTIHNGVDLSNFEVAPKGPNQHVVQICMVGMLTPWKGQHNLVRAAHRVIRAGHVRVRFVLAGAEVYQTAGERGYQSRLEKLINELGLKEYFELVGFQDDIRQIYWKSDLAVHASTRPEPFGKVIVEAMACGLPVVATRGGGVREIVEDGKTGILVGMDDVDDLARALEELIVDANLREKMGQAGRQRVAEKFESTRFVRGVLDVLEESSAT